MTQEHPITPPDELVYQWKKEASNRHYTVTESCEYIATQAARWGADLELEALLELADQFLTPEQMRYLREIRRPKQPSLKEQALKAATEMADCMKAGFVPKRSDLYIIRRALETLPD